MKKNKQPQGLNFTGSLRSAGITFYQKQGQTIMRSSTSYHQKSCTRAQFVQRQRMRHTMALWTTLKYCKTMFTGYANSFRGFSSLANRMPAVYVTDEEAKRSLAFLMPGIPVSEGTLPPVQQSLGEVNGVAALLTDLQLGGIKPSDAFWLYTAEQRLDTIQVYFKMREVKVSEMTQTEEGLALVGEEFGDDNKGWALVHVKKDRCSTQSIITRCTLYRQHTTEEALEAAIQSYGKLVKAPDPFHPM